MKKLLLVVTLLASTSAFAVGGYAQLRGIYQRASGTNNYGGGASVGLELMPKFGVEGYFDYILNAGDATTMAFGGKLAVFPVDYLFIKAGAGLSRMSITVLGTSVTGSDVELVGNVGVALPIAPTVAFTIEGQYNRILATTAVNVYGAMAGVQFKF